jgi:hypothetical protein
MTLLAEEEEDISLSIFPQSSITSLTPFRRTQNYETTSNSFEYNRRFRIFLSLSAKYTKASSFIFPDGNYPTHVNVMKTVIFSIGLMWHSFVCFLSTTVYLIFLDCKLYLDTLLNSLIFYPFRPNLQPTNF